MWQSCANDYDDYPLLLGGIGSVVNCDESLFRHKSKNHRGRTTTKEFWFFRISYTSFVLARCFMTLVKNKSAKTLLFIIT